MRKLALILVFLLGMNSVTAHAQVLSGIPDTLEKEEVSVSTNTIEPETEAEEEADVSGIESIEDAESIDAENFSISDTTITVNAKKGADITEALDEALETAKNLGASGTIYTVTVPKGTYYISGILHIYSNTTLSLYGVTLKCKPGVPEHNMLITGTTSYNNSNACVGYTGFENISLLGGTYQGVKGNAKTPIRLFHATNVTVKDITITDGECNHQLEVVGIKNFRVEGCTFKNMSETAGASVSKREALQFDIACHETIYPDIVMDGTMMQDVVVTGCTFENVSRGVGTHSLLLNAYHDNIKITNNTFKNIEQEAITALNYTNVEISGNKMTDVGTGILYQFSKGDAKTIFTTYYNGTKKYKGTQKTDANARIINNTITTKYNAFSDENQGIKIFGRVIEKAEKNEVDGGTVPAGDYYISNVLVDGNTIIASGYGISLTHANDCTVTNNTITGKGYNSKDPVTKEGIYNGINIGRTSKNSKIAGNTITSVQCNGIYLQGESTVTTIENNIISDAGKEGIFLYEKSQVTGSVKNNKISGSKSDGISIDDSSKVKGSIAGNTITGSKEHGVYILNKATVSKDISNNTIKDCGEDGIIVNLSAKVSGSITDNSISAPGNQGVYVLNKASVGKDIKSNEITNAGGNGIFVNLSAEVDGNITKNTISKSKLQGIYLMNKATLSKDISSNKISDSGAHGICINNSANVKGSISKNTVKNSKNKHGIYLMNNATVSKNINDNTISGAKENGICVNTSAVVKKDITGNTITSAKRYGIYVLNKAKVNGNIHTNTITKTNTPIVLGNNVTANIRENKISKNTNNQYNILNSKIKTGNLKKPSIKKLSKKAKTLTVSWKKTKGVDGYYVELSTKQDFSKSVKTMTTESAKVTFKGLEKGKTYYVRMSTFRKVNKTALYSPYSKVKEIKL